VSLLNYNQKVTSEIFVYVRKVSTGLRKAAAFYKEGIQKLVPRYDKCLNNGGNMWKNSLKNVESDNNKILYEILIDFFYSETVLTV